MKPLPALQEKCLIFLCAYVENHGFSPSYAEIGDAIGLKSKHNVSNLLDRMERQGLIRRGEHGRARTITVLQSKYHHTPDCSCDRCAHARYLSALQLVHALKVDAPLAIRNDQATNFRRLPKATRDALLGRLSTNNAGLRKRPAVPSGSGA